MASNEQENYSDHSDCRDMPPQILIVSQCPFSIVAMQQMLEIFTIEQSESCIDLQEALQIMPKKCYRLIIIDSNALGDSDSSFEELR